MNSNDMLSIFDQINNLSVPATESKDIDSPNSPLNKEKESLKALLLAVSEEIQRILDQNNLTQDDLCRITGMSQSNISKIQNGKVTPRIETLQKIAFATHTRLVISFENMEGDE